VWADSLKDGPRPERKRRDDIKDCFDALRAKLPDLGTDKLSRAYVLHKAADYVRALEATLQAQAAEEAALRAEVDELRRLAEGAGVDWSALPSHRPSHT
jgi:hypothetical protein